MADYSDLRPEPWVPEEDEPEPQTADEVAEDLARDAQDARADQEFVEHVRRPFRPWTANIIDFFDDWDEADRRAEAEHQDWLREYSSCDCSEWLSEHDPTRASYGEVYAHPEQERDRTPERII